MNNQSKWSIDHKHCDIAFKVKHLMISNVKGRFKKFEASIVTIDDDFRTSAINAWIDTSSIDTGNAFRDEHLKSADFFDVVNFKQIGFVSTSFEKTDSKSNYEIFGKLTMKGITQVVKLNAHFGGIVKDPSGNEKAGFEVVGTFNRSDWGLVWNTTLETGGLMVSDEIFISCEFELSKQADQPVLESVHVAV